MARRVVMSAIDETWCWLCWAVAKADRDEELADGDIADPVRPVALRTVLGENGAVGATRIGMLGVPIGRTDHTRVGTIDLWADELVNHDVWHARLL